MDNEKLKIILDLHKKWLNNEEGGERANLTGANLTGANLARAHLAEANLTEANLTEANLAGANLTGANLARAHLAGANLTEANLTEAKGLIKIMGVQPGNKYWKRFTVVDGKLNNNGYIFKIGLNKLKPKEKFANDERILCSYPGFHFASRSWCAANYANREIEGEILIPYNAKINEPWATDGKASADKIIILRVFDTQTGEDVTEKFKEKELKK